MSLTMSRPSNARTLGEYTVFRDSEDRDTFVLTSELDDATMAIFGDPRELASFRRGMENVADGQFVDPDF